MSNYPPGVSGSEDYFYPADRDEPECLDGPDGCSGPVEYRMALSATGRSFPRCDFHWEQRLDQQQQIEQRYPALPPSDFDPAYAGESWDEE